MKCTPANAGCQGGLSYVSSVMLEDFIEVARLERPESLLPGLLIGLLAQWWRSVLRQRVSRAKRMR